MGSLILCHKKQAKQPYEITRIHRRIYTIEELCYYLCNNLYLIDYTLMNDKLCQWLRKELELPKLADDLHEILDEQGSIEQFVLCILEFSKIYSERELMHITNILEKLKGQKDVERQKFKADNLLESGELEPAILVYLSILREDRDESMDKKFYGRIYGCLGAAYGRAMLYKEAADMYEIAYETCREMSMITAYLYACSRYMTGPEYQRLLATSDVFIKADGALRKRQEEIGEAHNFYPAADNLAEWKKQYRRV